MAIRAGQSRQSRSFTALRCRCSSGRQRQRPEQGLRPGKVRRRRQRAVIDSNTKPSDSAETEKTSPCDNLACYIFGGFLIFCCHARERCARRNHPSRRNAQKPASQNPNVRMAAVRSHAPRSLCARQQLPRAVDACRGTRSPNQSPLLEDELSSKIKPI